MKPLLETKIGLLHIDRLFSCPLFNTIKLSLGQRIRKGPMPIECCPSPAIKKYSTGIDAQAGSQLQRGLDWEATGRKTTWYIISKSFFIDGHENREREIETGIPQGSPVSPLLFLIYISGVFDQLTKTCPLVTSLSCIDDLEFIASGSSVKDVGKALEKVAKTVIEWGHGTR